MKKVALVGAALAVALGALPASPSPAFTTSKLQISGGLRYGIYTGGEEPTPPNPYALGLGTRAGYTWDFGLFTGATFDYFFGSSEEYTEPVLAVVTGSSTLKASGNVVQGTAEVGYDVGLAPTLVLRPSIAVGLATCHWEFVNGDLESSGSQSGLAIAPGVQVLFDLGGFFLTLNGRYNIFEQSIDSDTPLIPGLSTDVPLIASLGEQVDTSGVLLGVSAGAVF